MGDVVVVVGAGSIGQAIARRISAGKKVLLADLRQENAEAAAKTLSDAGFDVSAATVDVSSRGSVERLVQTARELGNITGLIQAAGVSSSQAPIETILKVDLYGTALLLEQFGNVTRRADRASSSRRSPDIVSVRLRQSRTERLRRLRSRNC
jgi:NAD(P)-dependent dehydrogenase (short-subunit alcohol dehydrogenase family)